MKTKKILNVLCAAAMGAALVGCSDATAKLSDSDTVIMTVGDTTVTKGDIYSTMFNSSAASAAYSDALTKICAVEIEVTDEMRESAETTLSYYELYYGSTFTSYLESVGMTEEDYMERYLIPAQQSVALVEKYITENYETLCEEYEPVMATILTFSSEEDANAALSSLTDGSATAAEAAENNNSTSSGESELITINTTSYNSAALSIVRSNTADDGWTMVESTNEGTYYVLRVDDNDPANYQDEVIDALSDIDTIGDNCTYYYFDKYGFTVYDIDLYNALEEEYPEALVQAK